MEATELPVAQPISATQTLQASDLPISAVTVYTDRAEVRRDISLKLEAGLNRVLIENVALSIVPDSIRVDGRGAATIHEVQFKDEYLDGTKIVNPKVEELKTELEALKAKKEIMDETNAIIDKQLAVISDILANFGRSSLSDKEQSGLTHFDSATEQSLEMLYGFHERKSKQLKERIRAQRKEMAQLEEKIGKVEKELHELMRKCRIKKTITVDLENDAAKGGENVQLILSYQVHNARWWPSYDIRVQLDQDVDKGQENGITVVGEEQLKTAKVNYFGVVEQKSGEDWENVQLTLSTAQPSCGALPRLGTTYAQFYRPPPPVQERVMYAAAAPAICELSARPAMMSKRNIRRGGGGADDSDVEDMGFGLFEGADFDHAGTEATEQALSTTFAISQPKSIPEDGSEHKVTIAMLEFACLPHNDCVPSKNTNVFMTGTMVNTSAYPLLKGQASIYLNNCFNQKIRIESVSTGEKFDVPLGVVSSLKVTYKPANKFHHQTGVLSKSSNLVHEQKILAKNCRQAPAMLTIFEPIPKPTDEKIKIRLLSPVIPPAQHQIIHVHNGKAIGGGNSRHSSIATGSTSEDLAAPNGAAQLKAPVQGVRVNADNNLEWTAMLEGGREMEFVVKWEVEHPPSETVEFNEKLEK